MNKSEFLISGIETGQLNAMVKNVMLQTGIKDPKEAVRMLNAGELNISTKEMILKKLYSISEDGSKIENLPNGDNKKAIAHIYELVSNATFSQMFNSLSHNVGSLQFTREEINVFNNKYSEHLSRDSSSTFFLFRKKNNLLVAGVYVRSNNLSVSVDCFKYSHVWRAEYAHRLVVPANF